MNRLNIETEYPVEFEKKRIVELMRHDKKSEYGKIRLVLPTGLGECQVVKDVEERWLP